MNSYRYQKILEVLRKCTDIRYNVLGEEKIHEKEICSNFSGNHDDLYTNHWMWREESS